MASQFAVARHLWFSLNNSSMHRFLPTAASSAVTRAADVVVVTARQTQNAATRTAVCRLSSRSTSGSSRSTGTSSSSSSPSSAPTTTKAFEPPPIKLDPTKNTLHEKAARAAELHEELNALLLKQEQRRVEELSKPFGSGFVQFIKRSKGEMINIFAAFCCVLLAYQIAAMRKGARKLLDKAEEREGTVAELRTTLASLLGQPFLMDLSNKCAEAVIKKDNANASAPSTRGWSLRSSGQTTNEAEELERIKNIIQPIVQRELNLYIGDRFMSDKEKEEKHLHDLKSMIGVHRDDQQETLNMSVLDLSAKSKDESNSSLGMEELLVEIQKGEGISENNGEKQVLKRRKYAGSI